MAKRSDEDPYRKIRRNIPPPSFPIGKGREYDRKKEKEEEETLIEEGIDEFKDKELVIWSILEAVDSMK